VSDAATGVLRAIVAGERVAIEKGALPRDARVGGPPNGIGAHVLVASDRAAAGVRADQTAPLLLDELWLLGYELPEPSATIGPDEEGELGRRLRALVRSPRVRLILTTGGTGAGPRDVMPEVTRREIERELPGFGELMRAESLKKTAYAAGSRALAGCVLDKLIVNLPGSPKGAVDCLGFVARPARHVLDLIAGAVADCGGVRDSRSDSLG
jgi:molybdenum cofactor synthesis domain-containing protein